MTQPRLHRFDIGTESWLAPVVLQGATAAADEFTTDGNRIYASFDTNVFRFDIDGSHRTLVLTTDFPVEAIHSDGNILFVSQLKDNGSEFISLSQSTNVLIHRFSTFYEVFDSAISLEFNRIVGRNRGIPSDITFVSYSDDGRFTGAGDSPYHGNFPAAQQTWVSPDGASAIDDSGTIYTSETLKHRLSLGMTVTDLEYYSEDVPIVLSGRTLVAFDQAYRPTGSVLLDHSPSEIFVGTFDVLTFTEDSGSPGGFAVRSIPLSQLNPAIPGQPVNPSGLAYIPDQVFAAPDGNVLLFSWRYQSLFRWNPSTASYSTTIPISGFPEFVTYSSSNRFYGAHWSGEIRQIDLNVANPIETDFVRMPGMVTGLVATGPYVAAASYSPSDRQHHHVTFRSDGSIADSADSAAAFYSFGEFVWSDATQKLYVAFRNTLTSEEIDASGSAYPNLAPGGFGRSAYYNSNDPFEILNPVRVAPDGSVIVLGSGAILDAGPLQRRRESLTKLLDAVWFDNQLFTIGETTTGSVIRSWDRTTFAPRKQWQLPGRPNDLLVLSEERLLAVTLDSVGVPQFQQFEAELRNADPRIGFTLSKATTRVSEDRSTDSFTVVLNSQPAGNVVVTLDSSNVSEFVTASAFVIFTPATWNIPQYVTISGIDDSRYDDDQIAYVTAAVNPELTDAGFLNAQPQTLVVLNLDNEGLFSGVLPTVRVGDTDYFIRRSTSRIDRFDAESGQWLTPIDLAGEIDHPTAGLVDNDGLYVAFGKDVYRYDLNGQNRSRVRTAEFKVIGIHSDGPLLFLVEESSYDTRLTSLNKSSGTVIDSTQFVSRAVFGSSISVAARRIFGRDRALGPPDINFVNYLPSGQFNGGGDSPYHGVFPFANRTWVFSDGTKVIDDSGTVYFSGSLTHVTSLISGVTAVAFAGVNVPILASGRLIVAYSQALTPTGSVLLDVAPTALVTGPADVFAFIPDLSLPEGFRIQKIPFATLHVVPGGTSVDPVGLAYTPERIEIAADGTLLIFDKELSSIFRWNPATQSYGATIPLTGEAHLMAYSAMHDTIYVAYVDGTVRQIHLAAAAPMPVPFAEFAPLTGLSVADPYIVVVRFTRHVTLRPDGSVVDSGDDRGESGELTWSPTNQRLYFVDGRFSGRYLTSEEINANGLSWPGDVPGGIGAVRRSLPSVQHLVDNPVRVAPDGSYLVVGSGAVFDTNTLQRQVRSLGNPIRDAAWLGPNLYTIHEISSGRSKPDGFEIQKWNPATFELLQVRQFAETVLSLHVVSADEMICTVLDAFGVPQFLRLDGALTLRGISPRITIAQTDGGTIVSEDGTSDSFLVSLSARPAGNVVLRIRSRVTTEVNVVTPMLTLTPDNWDQPQSVKVTGINDLITDGDVLSVIMISVDQGMSHQGFRAIPAETVFVKNLDNESSYSGFLPAIRFADTAWFVSRCSGRIERFDLMTNRWLEPLLVSGNIGHATAAHVDQDGVYLAYGASIFQFTHDGSLRRHFLNTISPVTSLGADDGLLLLNHGVLISLRKSGGEIIDQSESWYQFPASIVSTRNNVVPGSEWGITGAGSISRIAYSDDGHFSFPTASFASVRSRPNDRLWLLPGEDRFVDAAGIVYNTVSGGGIGWIGTGITDVDFLPSGAPVVLSGRTLTVFTSSLLPDRFLTLDRSPSEIFLQNGSVFTFLVSPSSLHGLSMLRVDLAAFRPEEPGPPVSPEGLALGPVTVALATDGQMLLFSPDHKSIFRWNPYTQHYGDTIALPGDPKFMAYSAETNTVYVADVSGLIRSINLSSSAPRAIAFRQLFGPPSGLATAGRYLFVAEPGPFSPRYSTFRPDGMLVSVSTLQRVSSEFLWSDVTQKMYYFDDLQPGRDLLWVEIDAKGTAYPNVAPGAFGSKLDSPLTFGPGITGPIGVSPAGDIVVLGSGFVHNAQTLARVGQVPGVLTGMTWVLGRLVTIRPSGTNTAVTEWRNSSAGSYVIVREIIIAGTPVAIRTVADDRLLIMTVDVALRPLFTVLDDQFNRVPSVPVIIPFAISRLRDSTPLFRWVSNPAAVSYDLLVIDALSKPIYQASTVGTSHTVSSALRNGTYRAMVRARFASGAVSPWSASYRFEIDALVLLSPPAATFDTTPYISWYGHSDAVRFEIWINNLDSLSVAYREADIQTYSLSVPDPLPVGRYGVWVRSVSTNGKFSDWSDQRVFEVVVQAIVIESGTGNTDDATPLLTWQSIPEADSYEIVVQRHSDRRNVVRVTGVHGRSWEVPQPLPAGLYTVWVRGWNYGRAISVWGPGEPLLVRSPPNPVYTNQTISWAAIPEAVSYDIRITNAVNSQVVFFRTSLTSTTLALVPQLLYGRYRIEIRSNYPGSDHSVWRFSEFEIFHPPVVLTGLPASTMDQTLVVHWLPAQAAMNYEIVVQRSSDLTALYFSTGLSGTSHRIATPLPNGEAKIWVRAHYSNGSRSQWGPGDVVVIGPAPVLQRNGQILSWTPVTDSTNYEIWVNLTNVGMTVPIAFVRENLHTGTSLELPVLVRGRYTAWIRALRAEAGSIYRGEWSRSVEFTVANASESNAGPATLEPLLSRSLLAQVRDNSHADTAMIVQFCTAPDMQTQIPAAPQDLESEQRILDSDIAPTENPDDWVWALEHVMPLVPPGSRHLP